MFSEFTLTPTRTTENTVEKETVKIADKQAPDYRHLKQKTTDHIDEELRLEIFKTEVFLTISVSCYVRILEQGSKIHGEKSQSQLCWSISDFLRALLVSFDFDFSDALLKGTSRSDPGCSKAG